MGIDTAVVDDRETIETGALVTRGLVTASLAVVVNGAVTLVAGAVGVAPNLEPLSLNGVVLLTALGALGATLVYAALDRFVAEPDRRFLQIAVVVLLLSLIPDAAIPQMPGGTVAGAVTLASMHVTTAVVAVVTLTDRYGPDLAGRG